MFKIYDGRFEFYQWDLDRKIIVDDPAITEVHFCNKTDDCSLVVEVYELGGNRVANVPNILLQENWDIRVYGYCGECYTKTAARFKVVGRTKPADYVYTETEVKSWETMEKRCEEVLEIAEKLTKGATAGESFMDYQALVAELNTAEKNKYFCPQHFLIKTLNVPDVWVYEVKEESVTYEYVDDQTFAQGVIDGLIQIGYFVLSALETAKVDLSDYVKNTDYAKNNKAGITISADDSRLMNEQFGTNGENPYVPSTRLSFAVKRGLINGKTTYTDEEKVSACETIGAVPTTNKVGYYVYAWTNGKNTPVQYGMNASASAIAQRTLTGSLKVPSTVEDDEAPPKKYVDDLIANLQAQIDAIKGV